MRSALARQRVLHTSALAFCRRRKLVCAVGGGEAFGSIAVFKGFTFGMDAPCPSTDFSLLIANSYVTFSFLLFTW
jgi:hypothetical protein